MENCYNYIENQTAVTTVFWWFLW